MISEDLIFDNIFIFFPFDYTYICWCMVETSSDLLRSSSVFFSNLRKMFVNIRLVFGQILENLRKSFESGRKSSENPTNLVIHCEYFI